MYETAVGNRNLFAGGNYEFNVDGYWGISGLSQIEFKQNQSISTFCHQVQFI